ncbi:hypothetical protein IT570_01975 [Candidatus Sumerlaeota bacterium]|nr:hypothetical protein [Candidatus Sumerlaeota bacterium]
MMAQRTRALKLPLAILTALAALVVGWNAQGQSPERTEKNLRVSDVFSRPTPTYALPGPSTYDPAGPVLVIPDLGAWKAPAPTPAPLPTAAVSPDFVDLPRLPLLIAQARPDKRIVGTPGLRPRGLSKDTSSPRYFTVRFETQFQFLCSEYQLIPSPEGEAADQAPVTFFHAPGTTEQFDLPQGRWHLERHVWSADAPDKVLQEIFDDQLLGGGNLYSFTADRDGEIALQQTLTRQQDH